MSSLLLPFLTYGPTKQRRAPRLHVLLLRRFLLSHSEGHGRPSLIVVTSLLFVYLSLFSIHNLHEIWRLDLLFSTAALIYSLYLLLVL